MTREEPPVHDRRPNPVIDLRTRRPHRAADTMAAQAASAGRRARDASRLQVNASLALSTMAKRHPDLKRAEAAAHLRLVRETLVHGGDSPEAASALRAYGAALAAFVHGARPTTPEPTQEPR